MEPPAGWKAVVARRPVQWASVAVLVVISAGVGFFTQPGSERGASALVWALLGLFTACIWAGVWALTGRIRHGQARFGQHFVVATVVAVLAWILGEMESWQKFLLPGATTFVVVLTALTALVWVFALLAHVQVMNRSNWPKPLRIAATFGVAVFFLVLAASEYRGPWSSDVQFSSVLKAWPARLVPVKNPEQLTASLKALQDQLDHDGDAAQLVAEGDSTSD